MDLSAYDRAAFAVRKELLEVFVRHLSTSDFSSVDAARAQAKARVNLLALQTAEATASKYKVSPLVVGPALAWVTCYILGFENPLSDRNKSYAPTLKAKLRSWPDELIEACERLELGGIIGWVFIAEQLCRREPSEPDWTLVLTHPEGDPLNVQYVFDTLVAGSLEPAT